MSKPDFPVDVNFLRQHIVLHPEKFGVMGSYSLELLEAMRSEDYFFTFDSLAYRLTTSVLCGSTISEKPEVELNLPATPWQHLKYKVQSWCGKQENELYKAVKWWQLHLWVVYLTVLLAGWWIDKHKVKWTEVRAAINFEQRILYPEHPAVPPSAGRAVIYESLDVHYPETQPPFGSRIVNNESRFLNRHELTAQIYQDDTVDGYLGHRSMETLLLWLERHGVNVDQLVKRR